MRIIFAQRLRYLRIVERILREFPVPGALLRHREFLL